ncbi:MAG TPA: HprK-related kinase A [Gammaproteobacteria bacterium]|nr:HprK-related kinase A [Gammaproteobacteria bacterium]
MKIGEIEPGDIATRLESEGLCLPIGPLIVRLRTPITPVAGTIATLYGHYELPEHCDCADFHIILERCGGLRRWLRPQVIFSLDGHRPFKPLPLNQAFPSFEWGLNWCVATHYHRYLIIHSAVLEKSGRALILPGPPGAGKSTLCAALAMRGWRYFSDELTLVEPDTLAITPIPRPISLKNESIAIIRRFAPKAVMGPPHHDTLKGTVAHLQAPPDSVERAGETAAPGWIIFPRYCAGAATRLTPRSKASTLLYAAENGFNYSILAAIGFETAAELVDRSDCYDFVYSNLADAITTLNELAR